MTNPKKLTPEEEAKLAVERAPYTLEPATHPRVWVLVHDLALEMDLTRSMARVVRENQEMKRQIEAELDRLRRDVFNAAPSNHYRHDQFPRKWEVEAALEELKTAVRKLSDCVLALKQEKEDREKDALDHVHKIQKWDEQMKLMRARYKVLRAMVAGAVGLEVPPEER